MADHRPCIVCCRWFKPSNRAPHARYCGVACRNYWNHEDQRNRRLVACWRNPPLCLRCGRALIRRGDRPKRLPPYRAKGREGVRFCSQRCNVAHHGGWTERPEGCVTCGAARWSPFSSYCKPCAALARKDAARRKNNKRKRGLRGKSTYKLAEIALRDGFRCHLCSRKVDMRLSGLEPQGPTIDHLVPISAGGDDEPANVALAHRDCNTRRNTGGEVQLRLLG